LRDTQKDCGKPGCLNDYRIQVLARGDEMIEQERRLPPLARSGPPWMSALRLLTALNRTSCGQPNSIENDPDRR
jgi:hypothetical protein